MFYNWKKCTKRGLFGKCNQEEIVTIYHDLTDPTSRKELIDAGFVCKATDIPLPK